MNIEEAERLHVELLQNLPGPAGDAASALSEVIETHAPTLDRSPDGHASCKVCFNAQETPLEWPCLTIAVINAYAHVDGIVASAEAWWNA